MLKSFKPRQNNFSKICFLIYFVTFHRALKNLKKKTTNRYLYFAILPGKETNFEKKLIAATHATSVP